MRTVDPSRWWRGAQPATLALTRPWRFGAPRLTGVEWRVRRSFGKAMREWGTHGALRSIRCRNNPREPWERLLLRIVLACGFIMIITASVMWVTVVKEPPLSVQLLSPRHPISEVVFPGVAICSYNLISLRALQETAQLLEVLENITNADTLYLVENLKGLGALFQMNSFTIYDEVMKLLEELPRDKYNITELLLDLSPPCQMMLHGCSWQGGDTPCDDLFKPRITAHGYCCVFNGRYLPGDVGKPHHILNMIGPNHGLTVHVQDDYEDFAYGTRPLDGVEVLLFSGEQFPLVEAGGVLALPVTRGDALQLRLRVVDQRAAPALRRMGHLAGCHVYGTRGGVGEDSSFSHCVAGCRRRAARALCGCVPPGQLPAVTDPVCSLVDVACLHKHKGKFLFFEPPDFSAAGLTFLQEQQDALDCDCMPECAPRQYSVTVYDVTPQYTDTTHYDMSDDKYFTKNSAKLQIYYSSMYQELHRVEPYYFYSQIYAYFGCIWYLMTATSMMAIWEFIYFCSVRFVTHLVKSYRKSSHNS